MINKIVFGTKFVAYFALRNDSVSIFFFAGIMKATLWLCSLVTTMTMLTQSIYGTPLINYQYSLSPKSLYRVRIIRRVKRKKFSNHPNLCLFLFFVSIVQESALTGLKRTKPSLSIVNPLDVLRQRLLLEIARRQMRENSKQVCVEYQYSRTSDGVVCKKNHKTCNIQSLFIVV